MTAMLIHAALGALAIGVFLYFNAYLYKGGWHGSRVSLLEAVYYGLAIGSLCVGWYFNAQYMHTYPAQASWLHFTKMLFTNPAAGSGAQDLLVTNAVLFPLWTISDGPRRGLRGPWIYFIMSLFTSFGFAMGLYLATQERQLRWRASRNA